MKSNFTQVPNEIIVDVSLSPLARLLYIYMLSMKDGWNFYRSSMANVLCCSRQKLNKVVKELIDAGLVERKGQDRGEGGIFSSVNYSVVTITDHGCTDHGCTDHGKSDHLTILNNNNTNNKQEYTICATREKKIDSIFLFSDSWKRSTANNYNISIESLDKCIERAKLYALESGLKKVTKATAMSLVEQQVKRDNPAPAGTIEERKQKLVDMITSDDSANKVSADVKNAFYDYYTSVDDKGWLRYERCQYFDVREQLKKWIRNGH